MIQIICVFYGENLGNLRLWLLSMSLIELPSYSGDQTTCSSRIFFFKKMENSDQRPYKKFMGNFENLRNSD